MKRIGFSTVALESILAFQKVFHLLPADAPIILESRIEESEINEEIQTALDALNPSARLAFAATNHLGNTTIPNILSFRAEKDYPRSG
jgi:hypothetical protein